MWGTFVGLIENALSAFHGVLGNWGLAIILFTVAIKVITWPLTARQVKSTKAMQLLQPRMQALREQYKDDQESQTREIMKLYQEMGVNPLMGCLPMLLQLPIWLGLYQAIIALANHQKLGEGFLFIPSLAFPNNQWQWVLDVGNYTTTWPYLVLPLLTIITQVLISRVMTPTAPDSGQKSDDPTAMMTKQMTTVMPLMFGLFALQFPAGLALYWVTNNVLTGIQYAIANGGKE